MSRDKMRTLTLEDLKKEMESEAVLRCASQEETIKSLHKKIAEQREEIIVMRNRCYVHSGKLFCLFCGYKQDCEHFRKETN